MSTATLTSKGQITIPAPVRASLGLKMGSRIEFVATQDGQYLMIAANKPVQALKGLLRKPNTPITIEQMNQAIALGGSKL
ncbi:MAG: AbrB/MazE/SpoVT family DNA-binding domain-containing protein [Pseudomonadota bacterium]